MVTTGGSPVGGAAFFLDGYILSESELRCSLRALARKNRDALGKIERSRASSYIAESVCALPEVIRARNILLYCAFRTEVETEQLSKSLLHMKKKLCMPLVKPLEKELLPMIIDEEDYPLQPGYCGIPEPVWCTSRCAAAEHLDIVILPGLVFDKNGNRLGYGGGYYDRFLACKAPQALRLGLAFSCQLVPSIPAQNHDMRLDILVTEKEILRWSRA